MFGGLVWRLSSKEPTCQCRRLGFNPWVRKILWRRKWHPHSSILVWETPWSEEPAQKSSWGRKRVRHDSVTTQQQQQQMEDRVQEGGRRHLGNSQFSGLSIRMPFLKTGQQWAGPGLGGSVLLFWTKSNHDLSLGHAEF